MWHYALVLCFEFQGNPQGTQTRCLDPQLQDANGEWATLEECTLTARAAVDAMRARPGWKFVVQGAVCGQGVVSKLPLDTASVYTVT